GKGDSRIRLRLRRRKAVAASRVVATAEGEATQRQRVRLEARVVRCSERQQRQRCYTSDEEMVATGNGCCRGGLGCGYVAVTRAASGGDGLCGCAEEEHRVMAAGAIAGCNDRGKKEAEEATVTTEVAGKRRKQ
ncbi:hypothetical protein BHE74_00051361, partial [Ensete ventricosum]